MTHSYKLSRRIARFRALLMVALTFALVSCDNTESFSPDGSTDVEAADPTASVDTLYFDDEAPIEEEEEDGTQLTPVATPELARSFAGGIPFGLFAMPTSWFGNRYNGAMRTLGPNGIVSELAAIRSRGGRIVLMLAGPQSHYKDRDGHFSLSEWKQRIDRFRRINLSSYISDGTIIAHYLIDEPYDPANWSGRPVSGSTLDEMAKYSKSIWPDLATVVRAEPYMIKWSGRYRYLDAAWAQYTWRKGNVNDYLRRNVNEAQDMGLGLVVGLAVTVGGNPKGTKMSPSEVESWGSALLSSSYPCAFVSYSYRTGSDYLSTSGIESSMDVLRRKAENRSTKSCRS
jgi:hypothetical protein